MRQRIGEGNEYDHLVRVDGELAASFHLKISPDTSTGDLGYLVGGAHEGRGVITRTAHAILDAAFTRIGLHRVEIRMTPDNERSRAVPERLGFRYEGILRECVPGPQPGTYEDLEVWGMLARTGSTEPSTNSYVSCLRGLRSDKIS